jgi:hypothetical protein
MYAVVRRVFMSFCDTMIERTLSPPLHIDNPLIYHRIIYCKMILHANLHAALRFLPNFILIVLGLFTDPLNLVSKWNLAFAQIFHVVLLALFLILIPSRGYAQSFGAYGSGFQVRCPTF